MSAVLIASIVELCAADHQNDPERIARWTRNKSPEGVRAMLAEPGLTLFVAEVSGTVAAVGGIRSDVVALNYVAPTHRFAGVSRALLAAMETELAARGHHSIRLMSSATARRFYRAAGWRDEALPDTDYSVSGWPMRKTL